MHLLGTPPSLSHKESGVDSGFSEGGGGGLMSHGKKGEGARERARNFCHVCLTFAAYFMFLWHFCTFDFC